MQLLNETLTRLRVGQPIRHANLSMYPLLDDGLAEPPYATLDDALAAGSCRVSEVSEAGVVPELSFENLAVKPVLLLDGEELVGAKQNRVLNLTILVAGQLKITIPVSCVEQGRWRYRSTQFSSGGRKLYARARAVKMATVSASMAREGSRHSDQGRIWDEIAEKSSRMSVHSDTGAADALYDQQQDQLGKFRAAFAPASGQVGAVFAINGQIAGLELFDAQATFAKVMKKLVESYALDALDVDVPKASTVPPEIVHDFLQQIATAEPRTFKAVGVGNDLRVQTKRIVAAGLEAEGRIVHLSAFANA